MKPLNEWTIDELVAAHAAIIDRQKAVVMLAEVTDDWAVWNYNEASAHEIYSELHKRGRYTDGSPLNPLSRVGVTFTPEQMAYIEKMRREGKINDAGHFINDELKRQFGEEDK